MKDLWKRLPKEDRVIYAVLLVFVSYIFIHLIVAIQAGRLTDGL